MFEPWNVLSPQLILVFTCWALYKISTLQVREGCWNVDRIKFTINNNPSA